MGQPIEVNGDAAVLLAKLLSASKPIMISLGLVVATEATTEPPAGPVQLFAAWVQVDGRFECGSNGETVFAPLIPKQVISLNVPVLAQFWVMTSEDNIPFAIAYHSARN